MDANRFTWYQKIARRTTSVRTRIILFISACVLFFSQGLYAQNYLAYNNWCQKGGQKVMTSNLPSSNPFQQSYPGCTVAVYLTGTSNLATIYSDGAGDPLGNPFIAAADGSFKFYAAGGTAYDVTISGAGLPAPYTFPAIYIFNAGSVVADIMFSLPASTFSVSGSPCVTASCNIAGSFVNQNASYVLRGPAVGSSPAVPTWGQLTQDDILPAFAINSFTCNICGVVEAGSTTSSPASGAASYSSLPASASVSDGTNTDTLSTPFTAWSLAHTYCTVGQGVGSTTFTLTAVAATTKTATQVVNCEPRYFGGVGSAGATSSVTASGTTAVLSTSDVLASAGISNNQVGSVIGCYTGSGGGTQYIYLLLIGGSHTFIDNNTGFAMTFNTPTAVSFVNQFGVTVSTFLYQTSLSVIGNFCPKAVS